MTGIIKDVQTLANEIAAERAVAEVSDSIALPPITRSFQMRVARGSDDPLPPIRGVARLILWAASPYLGVAALWGAMAGVLVPQQIALVVGTSNVVSNVRLVLTIGAVAGLMSAPIAGWLSDRTRARWGRRAPWMISGSVVAGVALIGLSFAESLISITVMWVLVQVAVQCAYVPLMAVLPDRVPRHRRAAFSAATVVGVTLGALGGYGAATLFTSHLRVGALVLAALLIASVGVFVYANPDHASDRMATRAWRPMDTIRVFWVSPAAHPDFLWVFVARLLMSFALCCGAAYVVALSADLLFPNGSLPWLAPALLGTLAGALSVFAASDRMQHRKPFALASNVIFACGLMLVWISPSPQMLTVAVFTLAFGAGMFFTVSSALASEVLPSVAKFGKDLGVMNASGIAPFLLAPAMTTAITAAGGATALLPCGIVFAVLAGAAVLPIRTVR